MRLASIKSLFAHFCGQSIAKCINGIFDSCDPTSSDGELVYTIAGTNYPSRPINTKHNKSAVLMELKKAVGALHSDNYNTSINAQEFHYNDANLGATTLTGPAKFYFGCNTERLSTSNTLISGVSTNSSPINLRISTGTTTTQAYNFYLIALYDALIVVQPELRQASVRE